MEHKEILLGVNIDHCATVRQARYRDKERNRGGIVEPDPLAFALFAEKAGADGITVHPREDGRHIQRDDVRALKSALQLPLNMEMGCTEAMRDFALEVLPAFVCFVPEKREEVTTEGGLDVRRNLKAIANMVSELLDSGIGTSLFIDPEIPQVDAAIESGSPAIELHTGAFANVFPDRGARMVEFEKLVAAAEHASTNGLQVNIGHGINYVNVKFAREIPHVHEMNIGHSIVSRALFTGVVEAVREMRNLMNATR